MNGIVCIDKPPDFTSFDVVAKCRGITKCRKLGHGGTLDPMATGVLPLFFGRATKAMDIMPIQDKRYTAGFRLGLTTDTQDSTGRTTGQSDLPISRSELETALNGFRGELEQTPPMYSAVQVDGRRLYDLARLGVEVERPARRVTIHSLELLQYNPDTRCGLLDVRCSKGTYIRTLLHDIGAVLGCGGVLNSLRRTEALGFSSEQCITLEQLQELADTQRLEKALIPIETAFEPLPRVELSERQATLFRNGVRLDLERIAHPPQAGRVTIWSGGRFLATAVAEPQTGELIMEKLFCL